MNDNDYIIDICNFNLSYGNVVLFKDFNLQIKRGQCAGLFGPTGIGKTSLLNKIVNDYINSYKISYVFQDNKLLENLSVKENIILPLKNIFSRETIEEKVNNIINLINLDNKINKKVSVLSGGERQRVNLGRAFVYPCEIMLMDEPFSSQDMENKGNLIGLTKKIIHTGKITSIIISHNIEDLENLCDFIIKL